MVAVTNLIGTGFPARQAGLVGFTPTNKTGVGTAQVGATPITSNLTNATTAGGATAFIIPSELPGAGPLMLFNSTATTALVYPPVGGTIQGGAVNASFSVATLKTAWFVAIAPLTWVVNLSA